MNVLIENEEFFHLMLEDNHCSEKEGIREWIRTIHTMLDSTTPLSETVPLEDFLAMFKYGLLANLLKSVISSALITDS